MSIESQILERYGHTTLTDADIGKVIMCVLHNFTVKGVLTKINPPIERGIYVMVRRSDNVSMIVLLGHPRGLKPIRIRDIIKKHVTRLLTNLPKDLARYVADYV